MSKRSGKNIIFQTEKQRVNDRRRKIVLIFAVCVLGALVVSGSAILKKRDFSFGGDTKTTADTERGETEPEAPEADKTYLLWCADSETSQIYFAWTLGLKTPERRATVRPLDPNMHLAFGGTEGPAGEIYARFGENALARALENKLGIRVDGYIGSNEESFKAAVNYMGGFEITISEQIERRGPDFSLILVRGKQKLKGDVLFKYLRYLSLLGEDGRRALASAALEIADGAFSPKRSGDAERVFSKISNSLKTDLTIVDFLSSKAWIEFLIENGLLSKKIENPDGAPDKNKP